MRIDLQYPHPVLWPNGRTKSAAYRRRLQGQHKTWAFQAAGMGTKRLEQRAATIKLIVSPKSKGPMPDRDNIIAACKYYLDGIALATGLNDRFFAAPIVEFAARDPYGRIVIEVGQ